MYVAEKIVPKNKYNVVPDSVTGEGNKQLTHVVQIGLAVKDMDHAMAQMLRIFGAVPSATNELTPPDAMFRGEPASFSLKIAYYDFANIEFELIQPLAGDSAWKDHFKENTCSLHHVRFNVRDFDGVVSDMASKGVEIYQEGKVGLDPRYRWAYFDTIAPLGFSVEILGIAKELEDQL
jgi:hypothetical protein